MFYFPSVGTYWDSITPCQVEEPASSLDRYYLNMETKYYYPFNFSSDGIPLYKMDFNKEIFQPTVICQYALGVYEKLFKTGFNDQDLLNKFIKQANWLVKNQKKLNNGSGWELRFDIPVYKLKQPWISALTQGEAISVLCRAFKLTKKEIYLETAEAAMVPFQYDISEGGVRNYFNNIPVYEEYPSRKLNFVLNGFIFSLFGLYDLYLTTKDKRAKELFTQGVGSLLKLLKFFDTGIWSQYNLYRYPQVYLSSYKYHRLHIEQLKVLSILTKEKELEYYYFTWKEYDRSIINRTRALLKKLAS